MVNIKTVLIFIFALVIFISLGIFEVKKNMEPTMEAIKVHNAQINLLIKNLN